MESLLRRQNWRKGMKFRRFMIISALGADPDSRFFYNRTKGEMERDVLAQEFPKLIFLSRHSSPETGKKNGLLKPHGKS